MQVQARQQADNEKSADRVRNCVDSNKFQVELESQIQEPQAVSTPPLSKSKKKTKLFLTPSSCKKFCKRVLSTPKQSDSLNKLNKKIKDIFSKNNR